MTNCQTQIYNGDVMAWAKGYTGEKFHAALMDAPYHYSSITKRFGGEKSAKAQFGKDGAFQRLSGGFMSAQWDGVDANGDGVSMLKETWAAIATHLHPGAFLFVFAGTLNDDLISLAMREAGLVKHHSLYWTHSQGFPKATRVGGKDYEATGEMKKGAATSNTNSLNPFQSEFSIKVPISETARRFAGHRYGRQLIKPAVEVILCFQKSYAGRPIESITATGAGTINIEKGRIKGTAGVRKEEIARNGGVFGGNQTRPYIEEALAQGVPSRPTYETDSAGRWPSNFLLDEESAALLDAQSGTLKSGLMKAGQERVKSLGDGGYSGSMPDRIANSTYGDSGGSSRFFFQSNWQAEEHEPFRYCAKAGRLEREAGLEGFELRPKSGHIQQSEGRKMHGDTETFPCRNNHPCIKPVRLTKYLASLLSSPPEYAPRRILVPFSGSGSEMVGCVLSGGWEFVQGIELSSEYARIAEARIKFWKMNSGLFESLTEDTDDAPTDAQETLF